MANYEQNVVYFSIKTSCFFGHIMRKDKLEYLAVTGKIVGKRARGRRRVLFADQLGKLANCDNIIELFGKHQKENSLLPKS